MEVLQCLEVGSESYGNTCTMYVPRYCFLYTGFYVRRSYIAFQLILYHDVSSSSRKLSDTLPKNIDSLGIQFVSSTE